MKTKKLLLMGIILFFGINSFAQNVGINDDNSEPDPSAILDIKSSDKGLLMPRVQLDDVNTAAPVSNPATGLIIFADIASVEDEGFYYWNGSKWVKLITTTGTGDIPNLQDVLNEGNSANYMRITDLSEPMNLQDAATKYYVDNNDDVNDADYDNTNETIQTFSFNTTSNIITVNDGSGDKTVDLSILNDDTDADASITNEIQDLSLSDNTLLLSNDATTVDLTKYLDNTDSQTLSINGLNLSISGGNSISLPDNSGFSDTDHAYLYETDWFGNSFVDVETISVYASSGQDILLMYSCDCSSSPGGGTIELEIQSYNNTTRSVYCGENGASYPVSNKLLITVGSSSSIDFTLRAKNTNSGYQGKVRRVNITAIVN